MHARLVAAIAAAVNDMDSGVRVNVKALSLELGIAPKTFYKWAKRYRSGGLAGLHELSRRPLRSPRRMSPMIEDVIVELRKKLDDAGDDCGPATIRWHLCEGGMVVVPSEASIWRALRRRGFIVAEPKKRPKSAMRRFEAAAANELWQIDATDWTLADGTTVEIINVIDDHSRLCVETMAVKTTTTTLAWEAFSHAVDRYGLPAGSLSDNGLAFTGRLHDCEVFFETQLRLAGVRAIHARPFHPQTCGKVERFQQTLKKWLRKRRAANLAELQTLLDEFRRHYNTERPHRGIGRITPWQRWTNSPRVSLTAAPLPAPDRHTRTVADDKGVVAAGRWLINIGHRYARQHVETLLWDNHAAVFVDGHLVRELDLDPDRRFHGLRPTKAALP